MTDYGGWVFIASWAGGVVLLGLAFAWALLQRRRPDGRTELSLEALAPSPDAVRAGRANHWQDWANVVLGLWLFLSPWVLGFAGGDAIKIAAAAIAWITGSLLAALALGAVYRLTRLIEGAVIVVGLWLVSAPWILGFWRNPAIGWDYVIVGALAAALAAWDLQTIPRRLADAGRAEPASGREHGAHPT